MGASHNAYTIGAAMRFQSQEAQGKANRVTKHHGMLLETKIKANASGRPGPRVITGNYRRSWTSRHSGMTSIVGSNAPQARRLEYGFVGPDVLGRVFNQPPYPHVGPAVTVIRPVYFLEIAKIPDLGG
jgi:hypothetical protein